MPKKKKTRQQKIIADKRKEVHSFSTYSLSSESLKQQVKHPTIAVEKTVTVTTSSYQYLTKDLRKTALFTGFIMLIELVLKFFTR
jgi:hypothetical protein